MPAVAATDATARRDQMVELWNELSDCQKCPLAGTRNSVVFGTGNADADLMFVGEAPGFHEDQQGKPFVGQAGKLLDKLLEEIGLARDQVLHRQRPQVPPAGQPRSPAARDRRVQGPPLRQIELIEPRVVCTLGNFATKLLSGRPEGITKVRGVPQARELGGRTVFLYPIFHPAAALYTPAMLEQLRADFRELPGLLDQVRPRAPPRPPAPRPRRRPNRRHRPNPSRRPNPSGNPSGNPSRPSGSWSARVAAVAEPDQLGLF